MKYIYIILIILITGFVSNLSSAQEDNMKDITESEIFHDIGSAIKNKNDTPSTKKINIDHFKFNETVIDKINNEAGGKKHSNLFGKDDYNKDLKTQDNKKVQKSKIIDLSIEDYVKDDISVAVMVEEALLALKLGHLEASTTLYSNILNVDKDNQDALLGLAIILHQTRVLNEAKKLYSKNLAHDPSNQTALNNFLSLIGEESPEHALLELKKLEAINPNLSLIPAQIAVIYSKLQDQNMAMQYFKKAYMLSPDSTIYRYNLALLLDKIGDKKNAIKLYRELIKNYEDNKKIPGSVEVIRNRLIYLSSNHH